MALNQTILRGFVDSSQLLFQFAVQARFWVVIYIKHSNHFSFVVAANEVVGLIQFCEWFCLFALYLWNNALLHLDAQKLTKVYTFSFSVFEFAIIVVQST